MPECQKIKKGGLDQYGDEHYSGLNFVPIRKSVGMKWLNLLEDLEERRNLPQRDPGRSAGRKRNLVHSKAVRKPQVAIILSILKCMFYITWSEKLD